MVYNLRTRFSLDLHFSQNHIVNYGASFKGKKVTLPSLKCQVFRFWSEFVSFIQLFRQQIQFSKIWLCHFLVYMAKYPHTKKYENPLSRSCEERVIDWRRDRKIDRRTERCTLDTVEFSYITWTDGELYGNNQYKKKKYNQHSSVFKELKNNDP